MERYFSHEDDMTLTDAMAESLLRTVKDSIFEVLVNPEDYRHRAQIMWAGSLAHNDLTGCGTVGDFATHELEHELSLALIHISYLHSEPILCFPHASLPVFRSALRQLPQTQLL